MEYPDIDMPLDEGIAQFVVALRRHGVETFESCQGGQGHVFPEPTVRFFGDDAEGYRAFAAALREGLPVATLRRYYQVIDRKLEGPWWEMTFRQAD